MKFSLTDLAIALSYTLDFMEIDFLGGITYHSKRVAYMALRLAELCGLSSEELSDLVSLAILHDNGIGAAFQKGRSLAGQPIASSRTWHGPVESGKIHCTAGEDHLKDYPFLSAPAGIILNHHENWDGSGFFQVKGEAIPLMARIIHCADMVELSNRLNGIDYSGKRMLFESLGKQRGRTIDPDLANLFMDASTSPAFWLDLSSDFIGSALAERIPYFYREMDFCEMRKTTYVFSRIIDSKSRFTRMHSQGLSERAGTMAANYGYSREDEAELCIAADLHDVGKLAVSNAILDKQGKLDPPELDVIQRHTYYTRVSLRSIRGFERITEWASNHHERIDGSGYPFQLPAASLDFNSRLLACLDIYQALTEERPYREALSHDRSLAILRDMAKAGKIDSAIVEDIDKVFRPQ